MVANFQMLKVGRGGVGWGEGGESEGEGRLERERG